MPFPPLPPPQSQVEWPLDIVSGYRTLETLYRRALALAKLTYPDPIRANLVVSDIFSHGVAILEALEAELPDESWIPACADALFGLGFELQHASQAAEGL
jgi:hypothetical protein